jgi:hypothetical protein
MKLFVPKTNSAGPMNFQKKRCLGRIGGGNIKHLFVPAANLNYNSFQSESDKNGLLVQIAIVHIPQSDVFCRGRRLEARLDYNARWAAQHPTPPSF